MKEVDRLRDNNTRLLGVLTKSIRALNNQKKIQLNLDALDMHESFSALVPALKNNAVTAELSLCRNYLNDHHLRKIS